MTKMVDGDKIVEALGLIATCWSVSPFVSKEKHCGAVSMLREVEREVKEAPNLTPPCYQPDGNGCAYQCYDGDDEPIDKCKECPLCYSDKQRHRTTLNEPLTREELENMEDTTPVWWDQINSWVLVYKGNLTTWSGKHLYAKGSNGKFYRRPLEGEEDT